MSRCFNYVIEGENLNIPDELKEAFNEYVEQLIKEKEEINQKYPLDVPNKASSSALLAGIFIENSFNPSKGDYINFFEIENEKVFIWTHEHNKYSVLVVEVNEDVKNSNCWITVASLIDLSHCLLTSFEHTHSSSGLSYKWMYYFNPQNSIKNTTFYGMKIGGPSLLELADLENGVEFKATDIAKMANIIELLYRDEKAFAASTALQSSFATHYCCLICETGPTYYHDHISQEPEIWEHISVIPEMEVAIVQACRAVEAIVGEPPNRSKQRKVFDFKENWKTLLGFEADSIFEKADMSYLDFYYKLFHKFRNSSAHSYGNIHYDLLRKNTVDSQCFAAKILFDYIENHMLDNTDALEKLSFNKELLSRVSDNMTTCLTKDE